LRAARWYLWCSVAVIATDLYFVGWPIFKGRVLHKSDLYDDHAPTFLDYAGGFFAMLLIPAMFGLGAAFIKRANGARTYFAPAAFVGGLSVGGGYGVPTLGHLDCANVCGPAVPSYLALRLLAFTAAVPAALVPAALSFSFRVRP